MNYDWSNECEHTHKKLDSNERNIKCAFSRVRSTPMPTNGMHERKLNKETNEYKKKLDMNIDKYWWNIQLIVMLFDMCVSSSNMVLKRILYIKTRAICNWIYGNNCFCYFHTRIESTQTADFHKNHSDTLIGMHELYYILLKYNIQNSLDF